MSNSTAAVAVVRRGVPWRFLGLLGAAAFLAFSFWVIVALPYFTLITEPFLQLRKLRRATRHSV
jgi:hypothetical protein